MATVTLLNNGSHKSCDDMNKVLAYVMREAKTSYDGKKLVTGINCPADTAYTNMMLELMDGVVTNEQMLSYINQLNQIFTTEAAWLEEKEQSISKDMQQKASSLTERLESQAGKMSEQNASDLEKAKKELQEQMQNCSDRMYHRILLPCLILTLLASVLVLLQML